MQLPAFKPHIHLNKSKNMRVVKTIDERRKKRRSTGRKRGRGGGGGKEEEVCPQHESPLRARFTQKTVLIFFF